MKAKLTVRRPGYKDNGRPKMIKVGTTVTVTGENVLGKLLAETSDGFVLNFDQDEAEVLDGDS